MDTDQANPQHWQRYIVTFLYSGSRTIRCRLYYHPQADRFARGQEYEHFRRAAADQAPAVLADIRTAATHQFAHLQDTGKNSTQGEDRHP